MKIAFLGGVFTGRLGLIETDDGIGGRIGVLPEAVKLADVASGRLPAPVSYIALSDAILEAPLVPGARIVCVGINFRSHAQELGMTVPERPAMFSRYASSLVGPGEDIILPFASEQFDYEIEPAVVIGRPGRHITEEDAAAHILGYTCVAENSLRDWQTHNRQAFPGKNFDKSGSIGPWIVTQDEMPALSDLRFETFVNGMRRQLGEGSDIIFSPAQCIAYLSTAMTLQPGDVITLGTPPGVAFGKKNPQWLKEGDQVEMRITGIGSLRNSVRAEKQYEAR